MTMTQEKANPEGWTRLHHEYTVYIRHNFSMDQDLYFRALYQLKCIIHTNFASSLQLHPSLYNPMDRSLPGSSVHGIL